MRNLGEGLEARVAVLTGQAAVTVGATDQGMVAGDLVNTAARLQGAAPPSTVLVGEATMQAAQGAIAFEEAGEQVLRGKAAPVPAWRAMRVIGDRGGRGRGEGLEPPFVGREVELRLFEGPPSPDRRGATAAPDLHHRPGGHRQEPPRVGVREVPRRARRGRLLAPRARPQLR